MNDSELMQELDRLLGSNPKALRRITKPKPKQEAKVSYDIEPLPDTYKVIKIGSHDWLRYWKEHPEQQLDMLRWKKYVREQMRQAVIREGLVAERREG